MKNSSDEASFSKVDIFLVFLSENEISALFWDALLQKMMMMMLCCVYF